MFQLVSPRASAVLAIALATLSPVTLASAYPRAWVALDSDGIEVPEFELTLDFSALEDLKGDLRRAGQTRGYWTAKYRGTPISIRLSALTVADGFEFAGPDEVVQLVGNNRANSQRIGTPRGGVDTLPTVA